MQKKIAETPPSSYHIHLELQERQKKEKKTDWFVTFRRRGQKNNYLKFIIGVYIYIYISMGEG